MKHRPAMLLILDGFGIREEAHGNAIAAANTPHLDALFHKYPFITLDASGEPVGLPWVTPISVPEMSSIRICRGLPGQSRTDLSFRTRLW